MAEKARFDLREFWPWYQRSWGTRAAGPPPFTLDDISTKSKLLPRRQRAVAQVLCILVALTVLVAIIWGLFH